MKISKFAEVNNVSVDTIRHYMDLGLVIPEKKGSHYFFDEYCQKDIELILEYKWIGFSLNEIKELFLYKNLGKSLDYEKDIFYQSLFKVKYEKIEQEIKTLKERKDKLKKTLNNLSIETEISSSILGVDLKVLHLFKCVKCNGNLILEDGIINKNQIVEGKLICNCGEEYAITSGVLTAGKLFEVYKRKSLEDSISDYIHETDTAFLENVQRGGEWAKKKLMQLDLNEKILLDLGSGIGFFLRNIYEELPEECLYIAVDIVIDQSGTSNYSFEYEEFLLCELNSLFKHNCYLLSSFILFNKFSINSQIAPRLRENFTSEKVTKEIENLQFQSIDESTSNYLIRGGRYEDFFVQGEEIYTYSFFGKRWG
ncbi:MerR family transcriptional regulator [Bacillus thuringiensis]